MYQARANFTDGRVTPQSDVVLIKTAKKHYGVCYVRKAIEIIESVETSSVCCQGPVLSSFRATLYLCTLGHYQANPGIYSIYHHYTESTGTRSYIDPAPSFSTMPSSQLYLLLPLLLLPLLLINHPVQCDGKHSFIALCMFADSPCIDLFLSFCTYCCFHLAFFTWIHLGFIPGKWGFFSWCLILSLQIFSFSVYMVSCLMFVLVVMLI